MNAQYLKIMKLYKVLPIIDIKKLCHHKYFLYICGVITKPTAVWSFSFYSHGYL